MCCSYALLSSFERACKAEEFKDYSFPPSLDVKIWSIESKVRLLLWPLLVIWLMGTISCLIFGFSRLFLKIVFVFEISPVLCEILSWLLRIETCFSCAESLCLPTEWFESVFGSITKSSAICKCEDNLKSLLSMRDAFWLSGRLDTLSLLLSLTFSCGLTIDT